MEHVWDPLRISLPKNSKLALFLLIYVRLFKNFFFNIGRLSPFPVIFFARFPKSEKHFFAPRNYKRFETNYHNQNDQHQNLGD